jgi:hypothetical protein
MQKKRKITLKIEIAIFFVKLFAILFVTIGTLLIFTIFFAPIGFFMIPIGIALYVHIPKYLNKILTRKMLLLESENNLDHKN